MGALVPIKSTDTPPTKAGSFVFCIKFRGGGGITISMPGWILIQLLMLLSGN